MKKTIFKLNEEEGKKINLELMRTHYFRRYLFSYLFVMMASIFWVMFILIASDFDKNIVLNEGMTMLVLILFILLITFLFLFKIFDLAKQYYDEKYEEDK